MKKNIFILCAILITLSLTAFGVINLNTPAVDALEASVTEEVKRVDPAKVKEQKRVFTDFIYGIGPRFSPMKKGAIDKAKTLDALFDEDLMRNMVALKSVSIIIVVDDKQSEIREIGYSSTFTNEQLELLQSSDYSTNFVIRAEYTQKNKNTGVLEVSHSTPHYTIVSEKPAFYVKGKEALITYLKENIKDDLVHVDAEKLQPAKLYFTVTKTGKIENVRLDRPSGYPEVDKTMIKLINSAPGAWIPAETTHGAKVDQELVVSFGLMGC